MKTGHEVGSAELHSVADCNSAEQRANMDKPAIFLRARSKSLPTTINYCALRQSSDGKLNGLAAFIRC